MLQAEDQVAEQVENLQRMFTYGGNMATFKISMLPHRAFIESFILITHRFPLSRS